MPITMPPREETSLLSNTTTKSFDIRQSSFSLNGDHTTCAPTKKQLVGIAVCITISALVGLGIVSSSSSHNQVPTGPYQLVECQEGAAFLESYNFYNGADSLGSAGYNTYVSQKRAQQVGIVNITTDTKDDSEYIFMSSSPTSKGPRESIRLEGKKRYNRGLFLLDLHHLPAGPGVWPAWWLTDEAAWPNHGEIDIVEGINNQTSAKTALHTSAQCSMYAQVPSWSKTGTWDRASTYYYIYSIVIVNRYSLLTLLSPLTIAHNSWYL